MKNYPNQIEAIGQMTFESRVCYDKTSGNTQSPQRDHLSSLRQQDNKTMSSQYEVNWYLFAMLALWIPVKDKDIFQLHELSHMLSSE